MSYKNKNNNCIKNADVGVTKGNKNYRLCMYWLANTKQTKVAMFHFHPLRKLEWLSQEKIHQTQNKQY